MFKRMVLVALACLTGSIAQGPQATAQKAACAITITPYPVAVNTAWHVLVSGLKPGQTDIVLGNGWNDGNYMDQKVFTADANGNIGVAPPLFEFQTINGQTLDPTGTHYFQVLHVNLTSGAWKLLCDESYEVLAQ